MDSGNFSITMVYRTWSAPPGCSASTLAFSYDGNGNLTQVDNAGTLGQPRVVLTEGYDQDNHRTSLADNLSSAGVTTFSYHPD
jgi:hypothetical protein